MDDDAKGRDEPAQDDALHAAQRRSRNDWFARALGDEWWSDGDGIYRRKRETHLFNVPWPPHDDEATPVTETALELRAPDPAARA